jgi:hypothetical protein
VIESQPLKALRQHLLLIASMEILRHDEAAFVDQFRAHIILAIREVWRSEADEATATAKADWLFDLLPDPRAWVPSAAPPEEITNARKRFVLQLAVLSQPMLELLGRPDWAEAYAQWFDNKMLMSLAWRDPGLLTEAATEAVISLTSLLERSSNEFAKEFGESSPATDAGNNT